MVARAATATVVRRNFTVASLSKSIVRQRENKDRIAVIGVMDFGQQRGRLSNAAATVKTALEVDILLAVVREADDMALRAGGKPRLPQGPPRRGLKRTHAAVEVAHKTHPAVGGEHAGQERR